MTASLDGTITSCSESAAAIFGYAPNQLVGRELGSVLPALSSFEPHAVWERLRRGDAIDAFRTVGRTRHRAPIELSVALAPLVGPDRSVTGASVTPRPLDSHELVAEAQARLAAIVDSSDDAIVSETLDGIVTSWNPAAERMFGYRADEVVGRSLATIVPAARRDEEERVLASVRRGERLDHFETVRTHRDGRPLELSLTVSPVRNADGVVVGVSRIARDISERTRGDEARARLAAIVDWSTDAIVSKSLDGIITTWNHAAERMFGYSAEEAIGKPILLIIPPDRRSEEDSVIESIRRGEVVDHFETVRAHKNGGRVHVSLTISPVKDDAGCIIGASKIARDIGDRLRFEAERERLLREAQASNRAKDEFLAMLGHELRNPLGAIVTAFHLLDETGARDPATVRAREVGARQAQNLAKLVDDLLDVGRVMTGKIAVQLEPVDLAEVVRSHLAALKAAGRLESHHVSLRADPTAMVCADPVRLEQVVANVVGNALRYTPARGHIRVSVERVDGEVRFAVEDDGVGISPELLPHVFDLFVQSERRQERSQGGLGVGLTLVRRLTELQDGHVEAFSEGLGKGSRFVVHLPRLEHAMAPPPAPERAEPERPRRRVLIVEDNDDAREMLRMVLELEGHEVFEAADGRAGVDAALRHRPEIALVDVGLPLLDGYEVARTIRTESDDGMVLVALTGYGSESDRRRAIHAGFDLHLRKPVDISALKNLLAETPVRRAGAA